MTIKAIIWDLEGVILRTNEGSISASLARLLQVPEEQVRPALFSDFNDRVDLGEYTQEDFWDFILETAGRPPEYKQRLRDFFFEGFFIDQELLTDVHNYHKYVKTCLFSNFSDELRPMMKSHWQVNGAFDEILISCEIGMIKPQPAAFQYALKRLGCQAGETIFIDDRVRNVEGAQAAGIHAILYTDRLEMNNQITKFMNHRQQ